MVWGKLESKWLTSIALSNGFGTTKGRCKMDELPEVLPNLDSFYEFAIRQLKAATCRMCSEKHPQFTKRACICCYEKYVKIQRG